MAGVIGNCQKCDGALMASGLCPQCADSQDLAQRHDFAPINLDQENTNEQSSGQSAKRVTRQSIAEKVDSLLSGKKQPPRQPTGAFLVNKNSPARYQLTQAVNKIGRDESNTVPLSSDQYISRHHSWILFIKGTWWVEDLGSTNGTILNGVVLKGRTQIFPGDSLKVGRTELVFEMT